MDKLDIQAEHAADQLSAFAREWLESLPPPQFLELMDTIRSVCVAPGDVPPIPDTHPPLMGYLALIGLHHLCKNLFEESEP